MATVIGLALIKINNIYELDAYNVTIDLKRPVNQKATGAGQQISVGVEAMSISIEEVVPRTGQTDWRSLSSFSVELVDKENKQTVVSATECEWESLGLRSATQGADTSKSIGIKVKNVLQFGP